MKRIFIILAVGLFARGAFAAVDTLDLADASRGGVLTSRMNETVNTSWGIPFMNGRVYDTNKGDLWVTPCTIHVKNTFSAAYMTAYPYGIPVTFINNTSYNLTIEYGFSPGIGRITFPGYQYRTFIFTDNVLNAAATN